MYSIGKANVFMAAALAAMGVQEAAGKPPVIETLLDTYTVSNMHIAQVGGKGQCVAVVSVNTGENGAVENRFVAGADGAIKLYADFGAMQNLIKSCNVNETASFNLKREAPVEVLIAPSKELISLHKAAVKDITTYTKSSLDQSTAIAAGVGLFHDVAPVGSLKRRTYDDAVLVLASLNEVKTKATADAAKYATLLTAAGVNPVTYKPIVVVAGT
jgi:hypothetical protein